MGHMVMDRKYSCYSVFFFTVVFVYLLYDYSQCYQHKQLSIILFIILLFIIYFIILLFYLKRYGGGQADPWNGNWAGNGGGHISRNYDIGYSGPAYRRTPQPPNGPIRGM